MINKPTNEDLINISNEYITQTKDKVKSRFTIIMATAKRAKQLIKENNEDVVNGQNALSVAVKEFKDGFVHVVKEKEDNQ
ncbi:MAG: DNA-directed RNA polymerase subunit omega [Eubacteriales bacterium]|nr:DNA-directed RNA polymerase subunit omega [Eubacteriales bacterium]